MNMEAVKRWWRGERTSSGSRKLFCLLLLLLVWHLADLGYQASQSLGLSSAPGDGLREFDSFSKPSIAAAILKQEARRLLSASAERQGGLGEAGVPGPAIQPLARLRQEIWELNMELDGKLMEAYYQNHLWDAYLDCYVQLLQGAPENPIVPMRARTALLVSEKSGRTDEIRDAMQHVTRFHRDVEAAKRLRRMVEERAIKNAQNFAVGAQ